MTDRVLLIAVAKQHLNYNSNKQLEHLVEMYKTLQQDIIYCSDNLTQMVRMAKQSVTLEDRNPSIDNRHLVVSAHELGVKLTTMFNILSSVASLLQELGYEIEW